MKSRNLVNIRNGSSNIQNEIGNKRIDKSLNSKTIRSLLIP